MFHDRKFLYRIPRILYQVYVSLFQSLGANIYCSGKVFSKGVLVVYCKSVREKRVNESVSFFSYIFNIIISCFIRISGHLRGERK